MRKELVFTDKQWIRLVTVFTVRNFTTLTTIMQIVSITVHYFPKSAILQLYGKYSTLYVFDPPIQNLHIGDTTKLS